MAINNKPLALSGGGHSLLALDTRCPNYDVGGDE